VYHSRIAAAAITYTKLSAPTPAAAATYPKLPPPAITISTTTTTYVKL
jgi:hypothetical protein